jgi:hypothetical protein
MGPPLYMQSVVDRNVVMRRMTAGTINPRCFREDVTAFQPQLTNYSKKICSVSKSFTLHIIVRHSNQILTMNAHKIYPTMSVTKLNIFKHAASSSVM